MSKKILKRSLALGALMAFVITGSAWAEEVKVGADEALITGEPIKTKISDYDVVDAMDGETDGVIKNQRFTEINSKGSTGGVLNTKNAATFDNCVFVDNSLTSETLNAQGGVIYVGSGKKVDVLNSNFVGNGVTGAK